MIEEETLQEQLSAAFIETYQRIERLQLELVHSPGTIVWKGPEKQYSYWQYYQKGKRFQGYVKKQALPTIIQVIERMKHQKKRLQDLKRLLRELKKSLRNFRIRWQEVLAAFEEKLAQHEEQQARQAAAQQVAQSKRYSENYRHASDNGDLVASKSELLIANLLYSNGVKYEYERPIKLGDRTFKPDFTLWKADGTMILWEHAGLLDDPSYARNFQAKLHCYEEAGFVMYKNLIVTKDEHGAFDLNDARMMLTFYKLV